MKLLAFDHVSLTQFKNYSDSQFSFGPRFNLISGLNGIGKTNLLDAVYYLATGKSYFTPFDQRIASQGSPFFRITGNIRRDQRHHAIVVKVIPGDTKEIILDHVPVGRISEHVGFIPIVFSAPRDIELVTGSSQARRRYIDHLLCQVDPHYMQALVTYNAILQQRTAALKSNITDLRRVLQTYDDQLHPVAQYVFEKRQWLQIILQPLVQDFYKTVSEEREPVDVQYESQLTEYPYRVLADKNLDMDINTQRTHAGIHKDDFALSIKSMQAKEYASQGQIKSLIFSMHLAKHHILSEHSGLSPVMILDDIFDKLDERRLARLLEILSEGAGQVFISDTDPARLSKHLSPELIHSIYLH